MKLYKLYIIYYILYIKGKSVLKPINNMLSAHISTHGRLCAEMKVFAAAVRYDKCGRERSAVRKLAD